MQADPLAGLAEQLEKFFQVRRACSVEELTTAVTPVYIDGSNLQVAAHFRPEAGLWIVDPGLETIALAYGLRGSPTELRSLVRRSLERGSYLRHLLLSDPRRQGELANARRNRAYTVEIVLSFFAVPGAREAVHSALLEVARRSELLYSLGINILHRPNSAEEFSEIELRQSFCWLLRDTRSWFNRGVPLPEAERLQSVEMENYRLPGRRKLSLAPATRLHLIHGHNGTGKSSLVEAIELAATGRIERFPSGMEPGSYYATVANDPNKPVEIQIELSGSSRRRLSMRPDAVEQDSLLSSCTAASFRLDQALMDRLVLPENRGLRGATLLQAFFPEDAPMLEGYAKSQREAAGSREVLPEDVLAHLTAAANPALEMERLFGWIDQGNEPVPRDMLDLVLPVPVASLKPLEKLSRELETFLQAWQAADLEARHANALLPKLNSALKQVIETEQRVLPRALAALERLASWYVEEGVQSEEKFQKLLDQWLEIRALRDLLEKETQIVRALRLAEQNGWARDPAFRRPSLDEAGLYTYQAELAEREAGLLRQLSAHESSAALGSNQESTPSISPPRLTKEEVSSLTNAGEWLDISGFGDAIWTAVEERRQVAVGSLTIGRPGWADGCAEELRALRDRVASLTKLGLAREEPNDRDRMVIFRQALADQRALTAAEKLQDQTWLCRVLANRSLVNALNELIAVFTPARWAYEPIGLSHKMDAGGAHEFRYKTEGDQEIDLRFNTAELNMLVVALFLLCAPGRPNPLGTLVLDDPLQNMDELTATAVARGLAKLCKLWPTGLQAILLFHGEDQLERFRREVPAAVYRLPWLSPVELPNTNGKPTVIQPEITLSSHLTGLQDLAALLEEIDASR